MSAGQQVDSSHSSFTHWYQLLRPLRSGRYGHEGYEQRPISTEIGRNCWQTFLSVSLLIHTFRIDRGTVLGELRSANATRTLLRWLATGTARLASAQHIRHPIRIKRKATAKLSVLMIRSQLSPSAMRTPTTIKAAIVNATSSRRTCSIIACPRVDAAQVPSTKAARATIIHRLATFLQPALMM